MAFYHQIEEAEQTLEAAKRDYLDRWGWKMTCNTPGSYWVWRRDFAKEDTERHARWKERGPGPLGWPSEPHPYGIITASLDLAVSMTVGGLDDRPECAESEDDAA